MTEPAVEIPNRATFKASEVCEIAHIPPYVLKSWEKEFPGLGVTPKAGAPRVYRRVDIEQVLKIKHLLFAEGLTLAGARRRLEGETPLEFEPVPLEGPAHLSDEVREKVAKLKLEMRSLLDFLSGPPPAAATGVPDRPWGEAASEGAGSAPTASPAIAPEAGEADAGTSEPVSEEPATARTTRRPRAAAKGRGATSAK